MRKKIFLLILITAVIILAMWRSSPRFDQVNSIPVQAVKPCRKNIYDSVLARGTIEEGNSKKIYTSSPIKARNIGIAVGDYVKKGDLLFEVEKLAAQGEINITDKLKGLGIEDNEIVSVFSAYGLEDLIPKEVPISGENTDDSVIVSPIDGTITELNVREGEFFSGITSVVTVSDLSDLYVKVMIPELYIGRLKPQQSAEITGDAFKDVSFCGEIKKIMPVAKQTTVIGGSGETVVEVIVDIKEPDDSLKPGFSVNAKIITDRVSDALTIPYECIIQNEENQEYVYTVKNGRACKTFITTGYELESETQVKSGLDSSDIVIINPPYDIKEGAIVHIQE